MKFSDEHLRDLAGERAFERGAHYARRGRVVIESCTPTSIRAVVSGTEDYDVRIGQNGAEPDWHCTCPAAEDGSFCKHLVATAIATRDSVTASDVAAPAEEHREGDLHEFLRKQSADCLAGWLMELAEQHPTIEKRLRLLQSRTDPRVQNFL